MPIIGVANRGLIEAPPSGELVVQDAATGWVCPIKVEWLNVSHESASSTGVFRPRGHEDVEKSTSGFHHPKIPLVSVEDPIIFIVGDTLVYDGQAAILLSGWDDMFLGTSTSESLKQRTVGELSPLILSQVKEIVTGISPKLQERLSRFEADCPGEEHVSTETRFQVNELVKWLCSRSDTVSATVSNDGMMSVATVFSDDIRLYVEIERDGSVGAAVTRERRYAFDISATTVADLTPEVILAAVSSI